jgi:hypothetical protein
VWWCTPIILALRARQEDLKFRDSLGFIARPYLKKFFKDGILGIITICVYETLYNKPPWHTLLLLIFSAALRNRLGVGG